MGNGRKISAKGTVKAFGELNAGGGSVGAYDATSGDGGSATTEGAQGTGGTAGKVWQRYRWWWWSNQVEGR